MWALPTPREQRARWGNSRSLIAHRRAASPRERKRKREKEREGGFPETKTVSGLWLGTTPGPALLCLGSWQMKQTKVCQTSWEGFNSSVCMQSEVSCEDESSADCIELTVKNPPGVFCYLWVASASYTSNTRQDPSVSAMSQPRGRSSPVVSLRKVL